MLGEIPPRPGPDIAALGFNDDLWQLCCRCWEREPTLRPRMTDVLDVLRPLCDSAESEGDDSTSGYATPSSRPASPDPPAASSPPPSPLSRPTSLPPLSASSDSEPALAPAFSRPALPAAAILAPSSPSPSGPPSPPAASLSQLRASSPTTQALASPSALARDSQPPQAHAAQTSTNLEPIIHPQLLRDVASLFAITAAIFSALVAYGLSNFRV